ncbi:MAG TPA: metallopeptidase TldD-related protein [Kofleriaceae bacterium]|nr:metallopeptidase TldD-related protein [Kofleriaceae bacterium]
MNRRELLRGLGVASTSALVTAFGCGGADRHARAPSVTGAEASGEVRTWLREAVSRLGGMFSVVHALAVTRQRTTGALDVLGTGVARERRDGVVLVVRARDGSWREQVSSELTEAGVTAAVTALVGSSKKRATFQLPAPPRAPAVPPLLVDAELRDRLASITASDKRDGRIVYAATSLDVDDSHVWSIGPGHDREQRLVRIRARVLRAAWNGTRPVVSESERAWIGGIDDDRLSPAEIARTTELALELMTPGTLDDKVRTVLLDPSVTATLIDGGVRAMLTTRAARRPEVQRRVGASKVAAPLVTLVDDPTAPRAYGGFLFDDEGELGMPVTLLQGGRIVGALVDHAGGGHGRGRRPGHVGAVEPMPSHLRLAAGTAHHATLLDDGVTLEGGTHATVDPSTGRVVLGAARAREVKGGKFTGRVYADIELVGELADLLGATQAISSDTGTFAVRDEIDGEPTWRSIEAPWVRMTGLVRARRRSS